MMVRNFFLTIMCLVLAGCAASPPASVSTSGTDVQKRQAVQSEPLSEQQQTLMQKAHQAMRESNWDRAGALLVSLKSQRPDVSEVHAALGWVARQQSDQGQAIAAYRSAFKLDPDDAVSANNLALLLREQGKFREAVTLLQEGIEYSPETADLHYNLAVIAELYLLDLELALTHYRRFRELTEAEQEGQLVAGWIADLERRLD